MLRNKSRFRIGAVFAFTAILAAFPILFQKGRSAAPAAKSAKAALAAEPSYGFLESKNSERALPGPSGLEKRTFPALKGVPSRSDVAGVPSNRRAISRQSSYILDSSQAPIRLEPAVENHGIVWNTVNPPAASDDDWVLARAGDREASRRLELAVLGLAANQNLVQQNGIENLISDETAETNPFVAAIRDNFGTLAANAPAPTQSPTPPKEDTATVKSPPPPSGGGSQETTTPTVRTGTEIPATARNYSVLVGDFGSHQLQILNATKMEGNSFAVDGGQGPIRFDSGLDLGPLQAFALSQPGSQIYPDMLILDRRYGLVDIYKGIAPGKFAFQEGFTFSAGELSGAAAVDVDGDGARDLLIATHIIGADYSDQGFVYVFLSKDSAFIYQRRIPLLFPAGGVYATRQGDRLQILAVNKTLSIGEIVVLDSTGAITTHVENLSPARRQDAKLNFADGRAVWARLAEFADFGMDVNFVGAFDDRDFFLVGTLDNLRPFPVLALGDLGQNSQRRCWIRF